MLDRLLGKKKARVFLGTLSVVPRTDFKRHLEQWTLIEKEDMGVHLRRSLDEIFTLPLAEDVKNPTRQDLAFDVVVPKYQSGDYMSLYLSDFDMPVPLFWRPKITISARLYYLKSGKTKKTFLTTSKLEWRLYVSCILHPLALLGIKTGFDSIITEYLLSKACCELLDKMRREV